MVSAVLLLRFDSVGVMIMTHENVLMYFKTYFPNVSECIDEWFPNGKDSIRVRMSYGEDFIFTCHDKSDWCYETLDSYIRKMRGGSVLNC